MDYWEVTRQYSAPEIEIIKIMPERVENNGIHHLCIFLKKCDGVWEYGFFRQLITSFSFYPLGAGSAKLKQTALILALSKAITARSYADDFSERAIEDALHDELNEIFVNACQELMLKHSHELAGDEKSAVYLQYILPKELKSYLPPINAGFTNFSTPRQSAAQLSLF